MNQLAVTIGGVTIAMVSRETDLALSLRGPHERFAARDAQPDITVDVAWEASSVVSPSSSSVVSGFSRTNRIPKIFDSGGVWQLYREGELLSFHLSSPKFGPGPYAKATFTEDFTRGVVYLRRDCLDPSVSHYPLEYPLDELLITNWLALGRGVEVHACGVVDSDGAGYLFAGYSGAGKTTTARLWCKENGVDILSDDRIILRKVGNEVWMHGTPWHGDEPLASPACALLQRGFILHHDSKNRVTPITATQTVMELFARSFPPFFSARALELTLSMLEDVTSAVPFAKLGFVPDDKLPSFLRAS